MSHATPAVRAPAGTRWDCRTCGTCCRSFRLGPVEPEVIARLEASHVDRWWPRAAERPWYRLERAPDGNDGAFLEHVGGGCVFLRDDNLCAIHAELGADAKPGFCREFPYTVVEDASGLVVTVRAECDGVARSFEDGSPVADAAADIAELPRIVPIRQFKPETVEFLPGLAVDTTSWLAVEERLLRRSAEAGAEPFALTALVRADLYGLVGRPEPAANPAELHQALGAVLHAVGRVAREAAASPGDPVKVASLVEIAELLDLALHWRDEVPALTDAAVGYTTQLFAHHLLGKRWAAFGSFPAGMGAWLLDTTFARIVAERDAVDRVDAVPLGDVVAAWSRFAVHPHVQQVLRAARPALVALFSNATPR